jgi:hypothetical protein
MSVIDARGEDLGTVEFVRAADPKAAAFEDRVAAIHGLICLGIGSIVGVEPKVPPEMALKLFREGYVKIAAPHFWAESYYAAASAIERVEGRTVYLSLDREGLDAQQ